MRSRDALYDQLDRLPRPIRILDYRGRCVIDSGAEISRDKDFVMSDHSGEEVMMREYFNALTASEKVGTANPQDKLTRDMDDYGPEAH